MAHNVDAARGQPPRNLDELSGYGVTVPQRREILMRNGFCMMNVGSQMLTHRYMDLIVARKNWCPRDYEDDYWHNSKLVVVRNCAKPPGKNKIYEYLLIEEETQKVQLGLDPVRLPNREWMLLCLSTLNPEHEIFAKNYMPVVKVNNVKVAIRALQGNPNPNGLFDGLPQQLTQQFNRGGRGGQGMSQQAKLELKLQMEEEALLRKQEKIAALRHQLNEQERRAEQERNDQERAERQQREAAAIRRRNAVLEKELLELQDIVTDENYQMFLHYMKLRQKGGVPPGKEVPYSDQSNDAEDEHSSNPNLPGNARENTSDNDFAKQKRNPNISKKSDAQSFKSAMSAQNLILDDQQREIIDQIMSKQKNESSFASAGTFRNPNMAAFKPERIENQMNSNAQSKARASITEKQANMPGTTFTQSRATGRVPKALEPEQLDAATLAQLEGFDANDLDRGKPGSYTGFGTSFNNLFNAMFPAQGMSNQIKESMKQGMSSLSPRADTGKKIFKSSVKSRAEMKKEWQEQAAQRRSSYNPPVSKKDKPNEIYDESDLSEMFGGAERPNNGPHENQEQEKKKDNVSMESDNEEESKTAQQPRFII